MRILLLSDIHANWPALAAVRDTVAGDSFDACLCAGDLVDYGTSPGPCIDWVREHCTHVVRGNHDHAVAQNVPAPTGGGLRQLAAETRPLHWKLLNEESLRYLAELPVTLQFELGGTAFTMMHATPLDPLDEYLRDNVDAWAERVGSLSGEFLIVGHTHTPFEIDVSGTRVINPGSVGQPRDGDSRASFAIYHDGEIEFHRVEYDIDQALADTRRYLTNPDSVAIAENYLKAAPKVSTH